MIWITFNGSFYGFQVYTCFISNASLNAIRLHITISTIRKFIITISNGSIISISLITSTLSNPDTTYAPLSTKNTGS